MFHSAHTHIMRAAKECCRRMFFARLPTFTASASIIFWNEPIKRTKTTADAVVFFFEERGERSNAAPFTHHPSKGGERSNAAGTHRSPPPDYRRSRATECARLRVVTNSSDSWRSHVHRTHTAQRVQPFKPQTANANFLWVGLREGYLFSKKRYPSLVRAAPAALPPPRPSREGSKQKGSPLRLPFLRFGHSTVTDFARLRGLSISHPRWSAI